jgi:DNA repair protein RadD
MTASLFPPDIVDTALWPHQERAIEMLDEAFDSSKRAPLLCMPTGSGKTVTAGELIDRHLRHGGKAAFVVPRLSLIDQAVADFEEIGITDIGVRQGLHFRTDRRALLQVCSAQTLIRRIDFPDVDLAFVDEAHIVFKGVSEWIKSAKDTRFIGLSATPWSKGLGLVYDHLIKPVTIGELIENRILSPFRVFAPPGPDLSKVKTVAGEFHEGELSDAVNRRELVADVVQTWLHKGEDRPTLCYGVDRKHAQHLQERFIEAGIPTGYIDCNTPLHERQIIFRQFELGEIRIICNVATLDTGIDADVRCIIDARPTKSRIRYVQTIGRGLRRAEGKDHLIVLDHGGNTLRLGLVTQLGVDHLDDGKPGESYDRNRKARTPNIKTCKCCSCVLSPRDRECPQCGELVLAVTEVKEKSGQLVEFGTGSGGQSIRFRDRPDTFEQMRWYSGLKFIGMQRGYKDGWAWHKFYEKFGFKPQFDTDPSAPQIDVRNWVQSRQIAFAKAKQAAGARR